MVPLEINLRKEQWLGITIYQPPSQKSEFFLCSLANIKDHFTKRFDNYIAIGDFNLEPNDTTLKHFLDSNGLYNLLKGHSCFKSKISLTDLILTNRNLKNTQLFETGLSDHHHMAITCSKLYSRNLNRNNWFAEILKTVILKVSKIIYWKIWLPVIDMTNSIKILRWY